MSNFSSFFKIFSCIAGHLWVDATTAFFAGCVFVSASCAEALRVSKESKSKEYFIQNPSMEFYSKI
jgi:hypothetical protein